MTTDEILDGMQKEAEKLVALLKDRHTGMTTWWSFLDSNMKNLNTLWEGPKEEEK